MTKRVFRYFFDFIDGQEKWLNEMAADGWRLVKCGQLSYHFESCAAGEYEYAVEFAAGKSYTESKDYKAFLENMGYKTFYKNINVGFYIGKVQWRPWAESGGQIVTAPGGYQKELIIAEKKKDNKPFELHTDLTDSLPRYKTIRDAYMFTVCGMFALTVMCFSFFVWLLLNSVFLSAAICAVSGALCAVFGMLWLKPALRFSHTVRKLKEECVTNEYEAPPIKKKAINILTIAAISLAFGISLFWLISAGGATINSGSVLVMKPSSGKDHWNADYKKFSGFRQRTVTFDEGDYTFYIEIETESGGLNFSITGKDGTEYYKSTELLTSSFFVQVNIAAKEKLKLRVDAKDHSGSYKVKWD